MNFLSAVSNRLTRTLSRAPHTARPQLARLAALAGVMLLAAAHSSQAATITWSAANTISADTNVLTTGTKVGAFNIGDAGVPSTTVNTVDFASFAVTGTSNTVGNFTLEISDLGRASNTNFGSTAAPFANLSPNYQPLLRSGIFDYGGPPIKLTMGGLTSGTNYSFQWWANDSARTYNQTGVTGSSGTSVTLDPNTTNLNGGLGQFAIGTFTADSASQIVTFSGVAGNPPLLNAFQLRSNVVTPEPSTWAMMLMGVGALAFWQRKRRATA